MEKDINNKRKGAWRWNKQRLDGFYVGRFTILGHSDIGIRMNLYVHTTEDEKHKEIEKIAVSLKVV